MTRALLLAALAFGAAGCMRPRVAVLPPRERAFVAVFSGEMPGTFRDVARHSWIVSSMPRPGRLRRYEWLGEARATTFEDPEEAFKSGAVDGDVAIHGTKTGTPEELAETVDCLERETAKYKDFNCGCWPGPNSNTFVDLLIRTCGLGVELPATAVGKDYRGPVGVSLTESGTGVQLETWILGAKVGLADGVQADLTGLSFGVHFWPPRIVVPINPGSIGVDTSGVRPRDTSTPEAYRWDPADVLEHRYGAGDVGMYANYSHVRAPSLARGLSDRAVVALGARGVYTGRLPVGYAVGFDLEVGAAAPLGFAYGAHLYPAGIGVVLGDTGFAGVFSGIGTSGVSSSIVGALELPEEIRAEIDVKRAARVVLRGGVVVVPSGPAGRQTLESFFGTSARLGTRASGRDGVGGGGAGYFIGLERRQIMTTYSLGISFGYELGVGG